MRTVLGLSSVLFTHVYPAKDVKKILFLSLSISLLCFGCFADHNEQGIDPAKDTLRQERDQTTAPSSAATDADKTEDYRNTNRVIWQKPDMILELLGDLRDKTVADIGAGTGFFTIPLATKAQKVIAIDIDPRFVEYIDSVKMIKLPKDLHNRIETRFAKPEDPMLTSNEVDAIIIVNTFMYIQDKPAYLQKLKAAIRPGGRLLIVDFKKKRTPFGPPAHLRYPIHEVEELFYAAEFKNIVANDTALEYQYIIIGDR
jgi:SAM-dependent methyltransferase